MSAFKKNFSGDSWDAFIREISERCASATISQMSTAAEQMSIPQLRGYVRAHAWPQVWSETQSAVAQEQIAAAEANAHAARVLEQTVHLVTCEYNSAPVIAMPAPHISRRAA